MPVTGAVYREMKRFALIAAAGIVLAGCAGSHASSPAPPRPHTHYPLAGYTPVVGPAHRPAVRRFAQLVSPTRLVIVTWGSGSCPTVPNELAVQSPHRIRLHLAVGSWEGRHRLVGHLPRNGICTDDLRTTPMALSIDPRLVDVHRSLTISLFYRHSTKPQVWTVAPLKS
jgi:hypothetical protein